MKHASTYFRHLLTFLAGFGGILLTWNVVAPESVEAINKAGANLVEPLSVFIGAIFAGMARAAILWFGKKFSNGGVSEKGGASGGSGGILPLALFCLAAACLLPSCTGYPLTGSIAYRDPQSGAKGGLVFTPGAPPRASVRVPVYDPQTGELIGVGELSGPLSREISATK